MAIFTVQGSDGRNLPTVQPIAGSVAGSPFTVTSGASVETPELTGILVFHCSEPVHVRFSKDGAAATVSNMLIPAGQVFTFPADGHVLSMIAASASATVWVELALETGS